MRSHTNSLVAPTFAFAAWLAGFAWVFLHLA